MSHEPFMSAQECETIARYVRPSDRMMEWGAGGSTTHFSRLVSSYYSVEHDAEWFATVSRHIQSARLANITLTLVPPDLALEGVPNFARSSRQRYRQFRRYVRAIGTFGVPAFDCVLVDGRSRPECLAHAYRYLHAASTVFVHDFFNTRYERESYHRSVFARYELVEAIRDGQSLAVLRKKPRLRT